MNSTEKKAIGGAIATLMCLAKNSLSPTQTKMATRAAGELLWLLGIEKYDYERTTFYAMPPRGEVIDIESGIKLLTTDT